MREVVNHKHSAYESKQHETYLIFDGSIYNRRIEFERHGGSRMLQKHITLQRKATGWR